MKNVTPNDWGTTTLGDLAEVVMGTSPPGEDIADIEGGMPFIQGNAEFGVRHPAPLQWCRKPLRIAQPGDLLVSVRAPVGEMNEADCTLCIGRGLAAVRVANGAKDFVWHALSRAVHQLQRVAQGSTFTAVNREDLEELVLPLPPPPEQAKIAAVLGAVDEAVERARGVIAQTKTLRQALLHTLLTRGLPGRHTKFKADPSQIAHGWPRVHIKDLCSNIVDCPHTTPHFTSSGVPVIRTTAVRDGALVSDELTYTTEVEYHERTSRLVPAPGDIVFTREAPVAEAFVVPNGMRLSLGQRTMLLRPRPDRLNPHYFVAMLYEQSFRKRLMTLAGGSTTPHLNVAEVRDLSIPAPDRGTQDGVVDALATASARLAAAEAHLAQLERVKSALSAALLTGAIRVRVGKEVRSG